MYSRKILPCILMSALAFALFAPAAARAMTIYTRNPSAPIEVGDTLLVKILINTGGKEINALEGTLNIIGSAKVTAMKTGGSVFSLWPNKPSLSGEEISFVGGTPSGVYGSALRLFNIAIEPQSAGVLSIKLKEATAYLNDGKGTKVSVDGSDYTVSVGATHPGDTQQNDIAALVLADKNPPSPFTIELGRDESVYDNKYFISFYATDAESGINRYEVREGDLPSVRSGSVYVLRDQSLSSMVEVKAIDNARNARVETLNLHSKKISPWGKIAIIILAAMAIAILLISFFKRKP